MPPCRTAGSPRTRRTPCSTTSRSISRRDASAASPAAPVTASAAARRRATGISFLRQKLARAAAARRENRQDAARTRALRGFEPEATDGPLRDAREPDAEAGAELREALGL